MCYLLEFVGNYFDSMLCGAVPEIGRYFPKKKYAFALSFMSMYPEYKNKLLNFIEYSEEKTEFINYMNKHEFTIGAAECDIFADA